MPDEKKDSGIEKIIADVVRAASVAADEVGEIFQNVANTAGEKYDTAKLKYQISSLREEQTKYFTAIGRQLFFVQYSGKGSADAAGAAGAKQDAEDNIAQLLVQAEQKQIEINAAVENLKKASDEKICPCCGKTSSSKSLFCCVCGQKL